jgi:hypothetical protein
MFPTITDISCAHRLVGGGLVDGLSTTWIYLWDLSGTFADVVGQPYNRHTDHDHGVIQRH